MTVRLALVGLLVAVPLPAAVPLASWEEAEAAYLRALDGSSRFRARAAPETFCPAEWQRTEASFRRLREALGERGQLDPASFETELSALERQQEACRAAAAARVTERLEAVEEKLAAAESGLARGILEPTAALEELLRTCRQRLPEIARRTRHAFYAESLEAAEDLLARLDREVVDRCRFEFGRGIRLQAMGRRDLAEDIYRRILRGPCLGEEWVEEARRALAGLGGEPTRRPPPAAPRGIPAVPRPSDAAPAPPAAGATPPRPGPPVFPRAGSEPPAARVGDSAAGEADGEAGSREAGSREAGPRETGRKPGSPAVALTMWQSAWGDFSGLDELAAFARRNRIREVYLNPGLAISEGDGEAVLERLRPVVRRLRDFGIRRVGFLFAELNYDIGGYASFLRRYRDQLGIDTLVDDSEFTDLFRHRFVDNQRKVEGYGLEYAAFVTLETVGNSGVSDETRLWALRTLDQPILMSYFGCTLEEQQRWLGKYLAYADEMGRRDAVSVAILMGSKKVGREVSCEKALDAASFQRFVAELDGWARGYRSYRGLVLENNRPLPAYDVAPR